jgi:helicase
MDVISMKGKCPNELVESLISRGITRLNPPQQMAVDAGLFTGKNVVVAAPTASGKTLVAEMAAIQAVLSKRRKVLYVAPMRALVSEKFHDFKEWYPYIKSAISIGDLDSNDQWLNNSDLIFVSTEKLDSLIRHGVDWLNALGCIVFDEVHMLGDRSRGPTLELLITKLMKISDTQMVALSATVGNAKEIAEWMSAELVESDYRPVKLVKGVVHGGKMHHYGDDSDKKEEMLLGSSSNAEQRIVEDTLERKKQILIFYSTRRNAESGGERMAKFIAPRISKIESEALAKVSDNVLNALEQPTSQCEKLARLVRSGTAFHHAGLVNSQRSIIEKAFKDGLIKTICSTTTLGLGVNLPAHTVLVKDISRYSEMGSTGMPINEMLQLFGRAGRPKYDKEGRGLIIASTDERIEELSRRYLTAKPEPIYSALGVVPVLRTHILAFISEEFLNSKVLIVKFLMKTFYGYQYTNERRVSSLVEEIIAELKHWEFITESAKDHYASTKLGKRISELYIDPLSAKWLVDALQSKRDIVESLYAISNTIELRPHVRADEDAYAAYTMHREFVNGIERYGNDDSSIDPVAPFATALMLLDWMDEKKEEEIIKKYSTTPGGLRTKLLNADWIMYSASELGKIIGIRTTDMTQIRIRLKYGIKEELLDLVRLEQIGRVRARLLFNWGIKSVAELRVNKTKASTILGKEITERIFKQFE